MSHATSFPGYRNISRHDGLFKERVHDAYKSTGKLKEPAVCHQCGALYHKGHWQWLPAPDDAHRAICPACHRIHDHYPAGYLTLKGEFFSAHRDEIMQLVQNHERHERAEHPLKRIMDIDQRADETMLTTTDIHLARGIAEALHHAYQGDLQFHYNPEQYLLRVNWSR